MLLDPVGLDDRSICLEGEFSTNRTEFRDRGHHPRGIARKPMARIHRETPRLQLAEEILHPLRKSRGRLHRPVAVKDCREFPLGDDVGIELFERPGGGIAGIGKGGETLLVTLGIDPGECFLG